MAREIDPFEKSTLLQMLDLWVCFGFFSVDVDDDVVDLNARLNHQVALLSVVCDLVI